MNLPELIYSIALISYYLIPHYYGKNHQRRCPALPCRGPPRGKLKLFPLNPTVPNMIFHLAYTPGVAEPCLDIQKNLEDAYLYTPKGNLVAVISNGTAVLGLGDIGALAGKPVMEGKKDCCLRFLLTWMFLILK